MYTNLYLIEKLDRQRRQHFVDQADRDTIAQELVRNRRLPQHDKGGTTMLKLTIRYTRYILSNLVTVGFLGGN